MPFVTPAAATTTSPAGSALPLRMRCASKAFLRAPRPAGYTVTEHGAATLAELSIDAEPGDVVRACLDWTEQRDHIAGPLGRSLMSRLLDLGWIVDAPMTRAVRITDSGRANLPDRLGVQLP